MESNLPFHGLDRKEPADAETGVPDKERSDGMGAGADAYLTEEARHDFCQFRGYLPEGQETEAEGKHLEHEGGHDPDEDTSVFQGQEDG